MARGIKMDEVLDETDKIVNRIAAENHLPLEDSKHERLILKKKRRRKNKDVKWVKWLGIIMDESLTFKEWAVRSLKEAAPPIGSYERGNPLMEEGIKLSDSLLKTNRLPSYWDSKPDT